ncbi:MAG: hypothetical protein CSA18_03335 [Deltaproteobacteria bacterium]|nr:MAG: hypothetical protein CSA18_03335 [Deltaproteobacteria bacterium]
MKNSFYRYFFCLICLVFVFTSSGWAVDISDKPLVSAMETPAANLMFIIDDSESMNWEMMMKDQHEDEGLFKNKYRFIYSDVWDEGLLSAIWNSAHKLNGDKKKYWKTQCGAFNKIFYNPHYEYLPWPGSSAYNNMNVNVRFPKLLQFANRDNTFEEMFNQAKTVDMAEEYFVVTPPSFTIEDNHSSVSYSGGWHRDGGIHYTKKKGAFVEIPVNIHAKGKYDLEIKWPSKGSRGKVDIIVSINTPGNQEEKKISGKEQFWNDGVIFEGINIPGLNSGNTPEIVVTMKKTNGSSGWRPRKVRFDKIKIRRKISINNAHYYTWNDENQNNEKESDEALYLVNFVFDGNNVSREYFKINGNSSEKLEDNSLIPVADLPHYAKKFKYNDENGNPVYASDEEDLKSFAHWFQFYRTRILVAKSSIARAIYDMSGVAIGFYTINKSVIESGIGVQTDTQGIYIVDDKDTGVFKVGQSGGTSKWRPSNSSTAYQDRSMVVSGFQKGKYAQWDIQGIRDDDDYDIFIRWSLYDGFGNVIWGTRDRAAKYEIYIVDSEGHETLQKEVVINQQTGEGQDGNTYTSEIWNKIGAVHVNASSGESVRVKLHRGYYHWYEALYAASVYTSADAVKAVSHSVHSSQNNSDELYDLLYSMTADGGTPLRSALKDVGDFFDATTTGNETGLGPSPYKNAANGGSCQQVFAIILSDGYWNGNSPGVGNMDGDSHGNTLADVAAKYYSKDLAPDLEDLVPQNNCDMKQEQHMVTYGISFGLKGNINSDNYDPCNLAGNNNIEWGNPYNSDKAKIDDIFHATVNGHGQYFSAADPNALARALRAIRSDIEGRVKSGGALTLDSTKMKDGVLMFQAGYNTMSWSGSLVALELDKWGNQKKDSNGEPLKKEYFITSESEDFPRFIFTPKSGDDDQNLMPFNKDNIINDLTKSSLIDARINIPAEKEEAKVNIGKIVNYIRGESIPKFRGRTRLLGDIVHSAPACDGNTVYVGANDGMLHAFDKESGEERFGYVPSFIYDHLEEYTKNSYTHKFYVDLTPVIQKIRTGGNTYDKILVCGLGKGGKGYFSLTLKNSDFDAENIKRGESLPGGTIDNLLRWEFPDADDTENTVNAMGYSFGSPSICRSNLNIESDVAIFGNGYSSPDGKASIFIINADTGNLIKRIQLSDDSDNGVASVAVVDTNSDQKGDFIYAGDLHGNIWKVDISSSDKASWDVYNKDGGSKKPFFYASKGGKRQPVTTKIEVVRNHCGGKGFLLLFGTGKMLDENDMRNTDVQSIYGIWDFMSPDPGHYLGTLSDSGDVLTDNNLGNVKLLNQTIVAKTYDDGSGGAIAQQEEGTMLSSMVEAHGNETIDYRLSSGVPESGSHAGWYFDLPDTGERIVVDPAIIGDNLVVISFVPDFETMCKAGGYSWFHELDYCDGSRPDKPAFDLDTDGKLSFPLLDEDGDIKELNDMLLYTGTGADQIIAPSRVRFEGMLFAPAVADIPGDITIKQINSSTQVIQTVRERRERVGVFYWRQRR